MPIPKLYTGEKKKLSSTNSAGIKIMSTCRRMQIDIHPSAQNWSLSDQRPQHKSSYTNPDSLEFCGKGDNSLNKKKKTVTLRH